MFVVIDFKGHQYIIRKGDKIVVDKLDNKEGDIIEIDNVILEFDEEGKNIKLGAPYVEGKKVVLKVLDNIKGDKIKVVKFKNKNRYFRKYGFRPQKTVLQVEDIK